MRKLFNITVVFFLGITLFADDAFAQRRSTSAPTLRKNSRPTTSPYLNLLGPRGGAGGGRGGIGLEYFGNVRPQVELRESQNQIRSSLDTLQKQVNQQRLAPQLRQSNASQLTPSGHPSSFMSYGNYYSFPGRR